MHRLDRPDPLGRTHPTRDDVCFAKYVAYSAPPFDLERYDPRELVEEVYGDPDETDTEEGQRAAKRLQEILAGDPLTDEEEDFRWESHPIDGLSVYRRTTEHGTRYTVESMSISLNMGMIEEPGFCQGPYVNLDEVAAALTGRDGSRMRSLQEGPWEPMDCDAPDDPEIKRERARLDQLTTRSSPILRHIPHASTFVPPSARKAFLLTDDELLAELRTMTDAHTDDLFDSEDDDRLVFNVSRLVVDPERFEADADEPMAARGMGVLYTRTHEGRPLRSEPDREELLSRFYHPHHDALNDWARWALEEHKRCLILDCHSFPSRPLPCDVDQRKKRPQICLGTDPFHTPDWLRDAAVAAFESEEFTVTVDAPYSGSMVPGAYYRKDARVMSILIEVNRALFMDERTGERHDGYRDVRERVEMALWEIGNAWRDVVG